MQRTVIGVVDDVRGLGYERLETAVYVPVSDGGSVPSHLVIRTAPGADLSGSIRRIVFELDPAVPALGVTTVEALRHGSLADRRFYTAVAILFGGTAWVLLVAGLTFVASRSVLERAEEVAIRGMLGAPPAQRLGVVIRRSLAVLGVGTAAGLVLAWWLAPVLTPLTYRTDAREPAIFLATATLVIAVGCIGCVVPAIGVTRRPPAEILRHA